MAKKLIQVPLVGYKANNAVAKTNDATEVRYFASENGKIKVFPMKPKAGTEHVLLSTTKGSNPLPKHPAQNYFHAVIDGYKVQVSLKKIVGELRYWG